jgi:UDP-N-acetylmuramate dehydrogenase
MFQQNVSLKNYTTFKIGGRAKYFFEAENTEEIIKAVKEAEQLKIPIFVLGGGSKILIRDKRFKGLVLKIAGVSLGKLVADSIKRGLTGLEWAIGIPGTIAGAVHGNSGAFGHSIFEVVKNVTALDISNLKIKKYDKKSCGFGYRESIFSAKGGKNKEIILSVELKLKKGNRKKSLALIKEYLTKRRERIPALPSAGSIFKNLQSQNLNLKDIPKEKIKKGMIPAGYLIEQCGLKGKTIGGAKISEKHANIIVNFNKAKSRDVSALINLVKKQVKKKFGITLEEEIIRV